MVVTDQNPEPQLPAPAPSLAGPDGFCTCSSHPPHLPRPCAPASGGHRLMQTAHPSSLHPHHTPVVCRKPGTTLPSWQERHAEGRPSLTCQGALADRLHKIHTHTAEDRCDLQWHTRPSHGQSGPVPQQGRQGQLVTRSAGCPHALLAAQHTLGLFLLSCRLLL